MQTFGIAVELKIKMNQVVEMVLIKLTKAKVATLAFLN
jgi:hypothetical protein